MTKANIVREITKETGMKAKDVATVVNIFLETVKTKMKSGQHIEIRHFGTFKLKVRKGRVGRNPKTNDAVKVPERVVPSFKFSREFKLDILANVQTSQISD
ncbi:MAG: integration host factor subunit beta [Candidatus Cloacimonetes bacterium]|nr:integration host factor subunit beta [Candidatus Cloacimonadota bacterium]